MEAFGDLLRLIFIAGVLGALGLVAAVVISVTVVYRITGLKNQRPSDQDER